MIVARSIGRLGNQLFLYSAVEKARVPGEWVVLIGFVELRDFFVGVPPRTIVVPLGHFFDRRVKRILRAFTSRKGLWFFGTVSRLGNKLVREQRSKFHRIFIFNAGLCQNEVIAPLTYVKLLWLEKELANRSIPRNLPVFNASERERSAFVHVRRGDYLFFDVRGKAAALPTEWYLAAIHNLRKDKGCDRFYLISDDALFCEQEFAEVPGVRVLDLDAEESFLFMTNFKFGVLSASTFAWWAARLAYDRHKGTYLAPKFWMGFRSESWFPDGSIKSRFLKYV